VNVWRRSSTRADRPTDSHSATPTIGASVGTGSTDIAPKFGSRPCSVGHPLLQSPTEVPSPEPVDATRHKTKGKDFAWFLVSELLQVFVALISVRLVTSNLAKLDYGRYGGIYGMVGFGTALCASWPLLVIAQSVVRDREDPRKVAHSSISYLFMLSGAGVIAIGALGAWRLPGVSLAVMVSLAAAELFGGATVAAQGALAQSVLGARYAAMCRIAISLTRLSALGYLTATHRFSLLNIGIAYTVAFALTNVLIALWLRSKLGFLPRPGRRDRAHLKRATAFMGTTGAHVLTEDGDKTVMAMTNHLDDGALYYIAYRFTLLGAIPFVVMASASHTEFVQPGTRENEHIDRAIRYTFIAFTYSCIFAMGAYLFGHFLLSIIAPKYQDATPILRWLSLLVIVRSGRDFAQNALLGLGRIRTRFFIGLATTIVAMTLYIALIPSKSWRGALIATLVAEVFTVALSWIALVHYQRVENVRLGEEALASAEIAG
jgi:O-antigen/teichoic acid export membrane protein